MNKKIALAIWLLMLSFSNVLLFTLNRGMTATLWITFGFVWAAFISMLIFQCVLFKDAKTTDAAFLRIPVMFVASIYEAIQILLSVVFALCSGIVSWKATLLIHVVILFVAWVLILSCMTGNNHVEKVNSRQKDHRTEL